MDHSNAPHLTAADRIVGALAFASGSADVFAFLQFHDVFTSAMTGNTALLGLALGQGHLLAASRSLTALLGFAAGSVVGTIIYDRADPAPTAARLRRVIAFELAGLATVAVAWALLHHPFHHAPLFVLIVVAAAAMGAQSVVARVVDLPGIPTVVFTTTLTMIMMSLTRIVLRSPAKVSRPITVRQSSAMAIYLTGAALSGLLSLAWPASIAWPALIAVSIAFQAAGSFAIPALSPRGKP